MNISSALQLQLKQQPTYGSWIIYDPNREPGSSEGGRAWVVGRQGQAVDKSEGEKPAGRESVRGWEQELPTP